MPNIIKAEIISKNVPHRTDQALKMWTKIEHPQVNLMDALKNQMTPLTLVDTQTTPISTMCHLTNLSSPDQ